MIDHVWSVLCRKAIIDRDTNLVTLIEAVEQLDVVAEAIELTSGGVRRRALSDVGATISVIPVQAEVISLWIRRDAEEPSSGLARLKWKAPDAQARDFGHPYNVDLAGQHPRMRTRARISGLPARNSGRHYILVQFQQQGTTRWREVAKLPIDISLLTEGAGTQESE